MPSPRSEGSRGKRARVLVIDDEPLLLKVFTRTLSPHHDVSGALDPRTAVAAIEGGDRFDIIFCDMLMPTLSGIDVYTRIQLIDVDQARGIVFLTGDLFAPGAQEFFERTGNLHLQKPITPSTLRALVESIVG